MKFFNLGHMMYAGYPQNYLPKQGKTVKTKKQGSQYTERQTLHQVHTMIVMLLNLLFF